MERVDAEFKYRLNKFGKGDWQECYHCGNCSAVCPHTKDSTVFPRKGIRLIQMGLTSKIDQNIDPWLCYYCGDCSETCPRDANPGELMMTLRRYLTTRYDWTGLSGVFYTSVTALVIAMVVIASAIFGIALYFGFDAHKIMEFGHRFELYAILSVALFVLVPNIARMFWYAIIKENIKAPVLAYIAGIWQLLMHMFTQKRTLKCEEKSLQWFEHFVLVLSYLILLFTTVFLNWFNAKSLFIVYLGYGVGVLIFIITAIFLFGRIRRKTSVRKFSHITDWLFITWLFLMGFSAVSVRLLIDFSLVSKYLWIYLIHLTVLAQWALIIVPFGKWTHFLYRSFAIYIDYLRKSSFSIGVKEHIALSSI